MINTAYIKKHVKCHQCGGTDLKRVQKHTVVNTVSDKGEIIEPQKLSWRVFECQHCNYNQYTHTIDDNVTLESGREPALPFTCFDYAIEAHHCEEELMFSLFLNEKSSTGYVPEDDLRDEHVRNLKVLFQRNHMTVSNAMECYWEVGFDPALKIASAEEGIALVRKVLESTGVGHDKELEEDSQNDYNADDYDDYTWEVGVWDDEDFKPL